METKTITTRTANVSLMEDGIIKSSVLSGSEVSLEDAQEMRSAVNELAGDQPSCLLVDTQKMKSMSKEVRAFMADPQEDKKIKARAILTTSPTGRIIANFFIKINRPETPTQMFSSEAEAMAWLKEFTK